MWKISQTPNSTEFVHVVSLWIHLLFADFGCLIFSSCFGYNFNDVIINSLNRKMHCTIQRISIVRKHTGGIYHLICLFSIYGFCCCWFLNIFPVVFFFLFCLENTAVFEKKKMLIDGRTAPNYQFQSHNVMIINHMSCVFIVDTFAPVDAANNFLLLCCVH